MCRNRKGLSLPQLFNRHVLLTIFLHHLVEKNENKNKGTVLIDRKQAVRRYRSETLAQTFATAISKSSWVTWTRLSRRAYIPASVHTPWETHETFQVSACVHKMMYVWRMNQILTLTSAPEAPGISSAIFLRLMPRVRFIFLEWIFRMSKRACSCKRKYA